MKVLHHKLPGMGGGGGRFPLPRGARQSSRGLVLCLAETQMHTWSDLSLQVPFPVVLPLPELVFKGQRSTQLVLIPYYKPEDPGFSLLCPGVVPAAGTGSPVFQPHR